MKILITTDCYSPVINGVVTSVLNLRKELLLRGHEVRVLTLSQTIHSSIEGGVTYVRSVGAGKVYPGARVKSSLVRGCVRELTQWKPDIIHSQCEFSTFFLALKISKKLNIPIIHTYHTVYEDYTHYFSNNQKWGRLIASTLSKWVLNHADCVIVPTEKVQRILKGYNINREIRVIPTGIDLNNFTKATSSENILSLKNKLGIPDGNRILLYVGRLAKEKNLEETLTTLTNLGMKDITFLLVGDGPHRGTLENMVKKFGIESSVIFTGMVMPEQISDYYHLGDLFVSASASETQGLTYIEAMASGLPALCKKDDCLDGVIIDGKNGWQYKTPDDFIEKLKFFLESTIISTRMSHSSTQLAHEKFSSTAFADKVESAYYDVLSRNKGSRSQTDPLVMHGNGA